MDKNAAIRVDKNAAIRVDENVAILTQPDAFEIKHWISLLGDVVGNIISNYYFLIRNFSEFFSDWVRVRWVAAFSPTIKNKY